ncbi:MAG: hypothetical protein EAZ36_02490 [Verrucomicrobia bacterium]|nr:MAG: hypothetical protein EAZ36_02490 [Verrucomicrobiota bacterium]
MKPISFSQRTVSGAVGRGLSQTAIFLLALAAAGCATGSAPSAPPRSATGDTTRTARLALPEALTARWTLPELATRVVDGEAARVFAACTAAAESLGYTVTRENAREGKLSAARRPVATFDGARQETLEVSLGALAPGVITVEVALRESVEVGSGTGLGGAQGGASLIRDRASYDAFFSRLATELLAATSE